MAFWGTEVKPGKPYTHTPDTTRERLHISQATLGNGNETTKKKSVVQCNVGDKTPVFLCSLFPEHMESCQLNLEFDEPDDVIFSVIGPRSVHLTGYFLSGTTGRKDDDDLESYGEDIADTETERSVEGGDEDEDEYEDSFIDDLDDPRLIIPSPLSSSEEVAEALHKGKPKKKKSNHRRLRKKYQPTQSEEDHISQQNLADGGTSIAVLNSENEDMLTISSLCKSAAARHENSEAEENAEKETSQTINNKVKDGSKCSTVAETEADAFANTDMNWQPDQHESILHSVEVVEEGMENGSKRNKKKKKQSKKEKELKDQTEDDFFSGSILKWDQAKQNDTKVDQPSQDVDVKNEEDQRVGSYKQPDKHESLLHSPEASSKKSIKSKKKKKMLSKEDKELKAGIEDDSVLKQDQAQQGETKDDKSSQDIAVKNEADQRVGNDKPALELVYGIAANSRKTKKKRAKEDTGAGAESPAHGSVNREDKAQLDEAKGENIDKDISLKIEENQKQANDKNIDLPGDSQLLSSELDPENCVKSKRKRKRPVEDKTIEVEAGFSTSVIKKDNQDEFMSDGIECDGSLPDEQNQSAGQSANESHSRKKKKKKKMSKIQENGTALDMKESKSGSLTGIGDNNAYEKSCQLGTLLNALSEELEMREQDDKVASPAEKARK